MNEAKDAVPSKALANDGLLQRAACSVQRAELNSRFRAHDGRCVSNPFRCALFTFLFCC